MNSVPRRYIVSLGVLIAGLAAAQQASAVTGPHNMSDKTPGGQVCVTCHTPHKAPATRLLWNHVLSANNFSWSDATTTTGDTPLPANIKSWSGSTKNCLSCHDGTVEIGKIYVPSQTFDNSKISGDKQIATSTGDLKGNHPVAVPFPYGGAKNTYNGLTTGDNALASGWVATPSAVKIFTDPASPGPNNRGIECASCHDPHGTANSKYLRESTTGSALCLKCHVK